MMATLQLNGPVIDYGSDWTEFKKWLNGTYGALAFTWTESPEAYLIVAVDGPFFRTVGINKADPASFDQADFETSYKLSVIKPVEPRLVDGRLRISSEKTSLSRTTIFSHDWTDPTTWRTSAIRVVAETPTDTGNHQGYQLAHVNVIDTYHGKITGEDFMMDSNGHSYRVTVTVDGIPQTEQDPHYGTGGGFTLNYVTGLLTFLTPLAGTESVLVTYHYATNSLFIVRPDPNKVLKIDVAEVQFSVDVVLTDSAVFQVCGYVDVFAPQLMPGIPSGTKIPLGDPFIYKTMNDFQNDAIRSYPTYPPLGGNSWRGSTQSITVLDWDYVSATELRASYGMEIQITLQHNTPFTGFYSTATFYCTSDNEL